jgi:hypothetical protein
VFYFKENNFFFNMGAHFFFFANGQLYDKGAALADAAVHLNRAAMHGPIPLA